MGRREGICVVVDGKMVGGSSFESAIIIISIFVYRCSCVCVVCVCVCLPRHRFCDSQHNLKTRLILSLSLERRPVSERKFRDQIFELKELKKKLKNESFIDFEAAACVITHTPTLAFLIFWHIVVFLLSPVKKEVS